MSKKSLVLASFIFLFGLFVSKAISASQMQISNVAINQSIASDDAENEGPYDAYNAGEGFYIWTTTESKVA